MESIIPRAHARSRTFTFYSLNTLKIAVSLFSRSHLSCADVRVTDVLVIYVRDGDKSDSTPWEVLLRVKVPDEKVTFDSCEVSSLLLLSPRAMR